MELEPDYNSVNNSYHEAELEGVDQSDENIALSMKLFEAINENEPVHIVTELLKQGADQIYVPTIDNDEHDVPTIDNDEHDVPTIDNDEHDFSLLTAAANGNLNITKLLLTWHADPNQIDFHGNTPVFASMINLSESSEELIDALIEYGANINHKNCLG